MRILFDAIISRYPNTLIRLENTVRIIKNPVFESSVIKVHAGEEYRVSAHEKWSIAHLKLTSSLLILTAVLGVEGSK